MGEEAAVEALVLADSGPALGGAGMVVGASGYLGQSVQQAPAWGKRCQSLWSWPCAMAVP